MALKTTGVSGYNVAIADQSGKVGTIRYYQKGGQTYLRASRNRTTKSSNPRTDKQMIQRLKHASLIAMWKLIGKNLRGAFQYKEANQSDFNAFVQANQGKGCYMTKQEVKNGLIIPLDVQIANGSLPAISITKEGYLSEGVGSYNVSTLGGLSQALIASGKWSEGDQLTIVSIDSDELTINSVNFYSYVLDVASTEQVPFDGDAAIHFVDPNKLGEDSTLAAIHTDVDGASSIASFALSTNAQQVLASYLTAAKFKEARDSYGKATESFLRPSASAFTTNSEPEGPNQAPAANQVELCLSSAPSGGGTFNIANETMHTKGSSVEVTATPNAGYLFNRWNDGDTNATRTIVMSNDKSLTAMFMIDTENQ